MELLGIGRLDEVEEILRGISEVREEPLNASEGLDLDDLLIVSLAQTMIGLGVSPGKAGKYSDAVLRERLAAHADRLVQWIENETQELFCTLADKELSRIFLRHTEDQKEVDVGAIKPVLLPTTTCEINVFRVIRPIVIRSGKLLGSRLARVPT
jgi:hypothetical protein